MDRSRYFDNAATTPLDPRVFVAMRPWLEDEWANANSIHSAGLKARQAVEDARVALMELIGAEDPAQIVFTSGATEGANAVVAHAGPGWMSPFEHSAVREPALASGWAVAANEGYEVRGLAGFGAVMAVNNETGAILPPASGLVDATQALGKVPFSVGDAEFAIGSAHKFYGPKGVGFLYCRDGAISPHLRGGEQERGLRAGTLNIPGIVGMGAAARIALGELDGAPYQAMRSAVLDAVPDARVNGNGVPHILSLSLPGVEGETILLELDRAGFALSAGAACSSSSTEPSHVLTALGYDAARIRGTIRISFGRFNTIESAAELASVLARTAKNLRQI